MKRRYLFRGILLLFVLFLIEATSFALFWALDSKPFSYSRLRKEQRAVAGDMTAEEASALRINLPTADVRFAHPYIGYIPVNPKVEKNTNVYRIYEQRFFDPDAPYYRPDPDTVVIGVTGGSVAAGFCGSGSKALEKALQEENRFTGKKIVIVSLAIGGFKQPQALLALNYFLALGGRLDILLNIDGFNEVALHEAENGRLDVFPIYPRSWSALVVGTADTRSEQLVGEIVYLRSKRGDHARVTAESSLGMSITYNLFWRLKDRRLLQKTYEADQRLRSFKPFERSMLTQGPEFKMKNEEDTYDYLVSVWMRCSIQLHRICQVNKIDYYHYLQPNQYVEGSKPMSEAEKKIAINPSHPYYPGAVKGYPRLIEGGKKLREQRIPFFDLTPIFSQVTESLYVDAGCHFNAKGQEIMGREIARTILPTSDE